jgi:hypothetical protein
MHQQGHRAQGTATAQQAAAVEAERLQSLLNSPCMEAWYSLRAL